MKTIRRFAIASVALALGLPAAAQNVDTSATAPSGQRFSATPSRTVHSNNGSAKAVLAPYGSYITQVGVGAAGADVSEIEPGFNTFGFGMQGGTVNNHLADDFVLAGASTVSNYKWLTYQTGAATSGTISTMTLNLWNTDPLLAGAPAFTGPANSLTSQAWTGVYRVTSTTLLAINRAIIEVDNSAAWASALPAGTYWLDAIATGLISSGPWGPVVVPATPADNGRQFLGSSATWIAVTDGIALLPQGFLFQVEGTGGGGPSTFCTATPSSLLGCTSSLSGTGTTVSKSAGAGSYTLSAGPAPGGNQAGIFIWGKSQLAVPVLATFGWRCIPVTRGKPDLPGGTVGMCNGQYDWDVGAYVNTTGAINVGDNLNFQSWYRDPGLLPQAALFTDGVGPISVVP